MGWKMAGEKGAAVPRAEALGTEAPDAKATAQKRSGEKGKRKRKLSAIVAVLIAIFIISRIGSCMGSNRAKTIDWPTAGLATKLPEPPVKKGTMWSNDAKSFKVSLKGCNEAQYASYVAECKEVGFAIDQETETHSYEAYSEDGSHLEVTLISDGLTIEIEAPIEMGAISWPATGPASYVPAPVSAVGRIDSDSSKFFYAYIGETDPAAYGAYVDSCIAAGYDIDYHKGGESFYADNASGVHLSIEYRGFNTMTVRIDTSEMTTDAPVAEAPASEPEAQPEQTAASSSDARAAIDAYEAFMNDYCDFMEEYQAEGRPASMLAKYGEMMGKYADMAAKFDAIDEGSLSADDDAYYIQVQTRVNQRLLAVAAQ